MVDAPEPNASSESVSPSTLFKAFFILGCTAIGGSLAHLSAFRESLVVRRRWITNHSFADVVTLAQTLPGPTSTQVALGIGLLRGGFLGGIASILGFILPGAAFLTFVGLFVTWNESIVRSNWSAGLRAFACAVVALAVWGMIRRLTHGNVKGFLCAAAFLICAGWNDPLAGIACIAFSLILGGVACPNRVEDASSQHTRLKPVHFALSIGALLIVVIAISGAWLPMSRNNGALVQLIAALAQSGSLVFGGDHVILPLLEHSVVLTGLIPADSFLTGYSIAQVVPGPIFNVAAFAGVSLTGWTGACAATIALFLPGLVLMGAVFPIWNEFRHSCFARRALDGANAAVTGVVGWALLFLVYPQAVGTSIPLGTIALISFVMLWYRSPLPIVAAVAAAMGVILM